jgi:hypothetical protein
MNARGWEAIKMTEDDWRVLDKEGREIARFGENARAAFLCAAGPEMYEALVFLADAAEMGRLPQGEDLRYAKETRRKARDGK